MDLNNPLGLLFDEHYLRVLTEDYNGFKTIHDEFLEEIESEGYDFEDFQDDDLSQAYREIRGAVKKLIDSKKISRTMEFFLSRNPLFDPTGFQCLQGYNVVVDGELMHPEDVKIPNMIHERGAKIRRELRKEKYTTLVNAFREKMRVVYNKIMYVEDVEESENVAEINVVKQFLEEYHMENKLSERIVTTPEIREDLLLRMGKKIKPTDHYVAPKISRNANTVIRLHWAKLDTLDAILSEFILERDPEYTFLENSYVFFASRGLEDKEVRTMTRELMKYIIRVKKKIEANCEPPSELSDFVKEAISEEEKAIV